MKAGDLSAVNSCCDQLTTPQRGLTGVVISYVCSDEWAQRNVKTFKTFPLDLAMMILYLARPETA
jgi:hypothetical protein